MCNKEFKRVAKKGAQPKFCSAYCKKTYQKRAQKVHDKSAQKELNARKSDASSGWLKGSGINDSLYYFSYKKIIVLLIFMVLIFCAGYYLKQ